MTSHLSGPSTSDARVWFLGLDAGSHRAGGCLLSDDGQAIPCGLPLDKGDLAARLCQLEHDLTVWLHAVGVQATCTVVEDPGIGPRSNTATVAAFGVCLATAYSVMPCPTFGLQNKVWRARTPLGGQAKKAALVAWAAEHGVSGEDEAMAFGCAWAARDLARRSGVGRAA